MALLLCLPARPALSEAITAWGFEGLGLAEVHATVDPANTASIRLLTEIGFEHVRDIEEDDGGITAVLTLRRPA